MNWHSKAEKLEFYKDEPEYTEKPKRPPKIRKSKYMSNEEYDSKILTWEASLPTRRRSNQKAMV